MNIAPWVRASRSVRGEPRQVAVHELGRPELRERAGQRVGHAHRATQAELRLHEEVGQGVLGGRRHRARPAEHARPVRHRGEAIFRERDALHLHVGRVFLDPLAVGTRAVAVMEPRRIPVGDARELVERVTGERAEALEMRQQVRVQLWLEVQREQRRESRIGPKRFVPRLSGSAGTTPGAPARGAWGVAPIGQSTRAPDARTIFPHLA